MMSMVDNQPINRLERHRQLTKQRLIEAATSIIQQHGFAKLTIKAVTDLADVGYGTFYVHFESKEALIWEIFHAGAMQIFAASEQRVSQYASPLREFMAWVSYFEAILSIRDDFAAMFGPEGNPTLRARYQQYVIDLVLTNLQEQRYLPAPMYVGLPLDYMARFVAGTQLQLTDWLISPKCPYSAREMATLLFRTIYHQASPE